MTGFKTVTVTIWADERPSSLDVCADKDFDRLAEEAKGELEEALGAGQVRVARSGRGKGGRLITFHPQAQLARIAKAAEKDDA